MGERPEVSSTAVRKVVYTSKKRGFYTGKVHGGLEATARNKNASHWEQKRN